MKARTFAQRQKDKPSPCFTPEGHHALFIQALKEGKSIERSCKNCDIIHIIDPED